jgi:hypothetical protein
MGQFTIRDPLTSAIFFQKTESDLNQKQLAAAWRH